MASISCLPEEIQAYILSKLNGHAAAMCKKVCRLWKELIEGLETCMHFWLRCCLKEIPLSSLAQFARLTDVDEEFVKIFRSLARDYQFHYTSQIPWQFWREVYAEHYRCSYIVTGKAKISEFPCYQSPGEVSCVCVQDNVVYTGHDSGAVMSLCSTDSGLKVDMLYRHHKRVTDICFLNSVSIRQLLSGDTLNVVVTCSKDGCVILYNPDTQRSTTVQHYSKQVNQIRSWGQHLVAAANRSLLQGQPVWKFNQSDHSIDITCTLYSQSPANITAVALWGNMVVSGDACGRVFVRDWLGCCGDQVMTQVTYLGSRVRSIFVVGKRIICYTDDMLHISQSLGATSPGNMKFEAIDIYHPLRKVSECVAIRGPVLAIGFRPGFVHVYHMPDDSSWDSLQLERPAQVIRLARDHVHALDIADNGTGPVIAAATEDHCVYLITMERSGTMTTSV
ncbi:uncharacterized protein LOC127877326 [Dreissena polymorpha]|uniref:uncharacterized protein LOC127877326 n=1 Tax=Dreissena polymorpha TaxID=45954 RepID=UPI002263F84A|nr:uncharacterized protein LOC127877326 [Dreissena polymorpha]XP_052279016.1 uncharacterized protein LOC127877326 [Dreissena polymorpha]